MQLFEAISAAAQDSVKGARGVVAVTGELGLLEDKPGRKYVFGVPLTDGLATVFLNTPRDLAQRADLKEGDHVRAIGVIDARPDLDQKLAFRLRVGDVRHVDAPTELRNHRGCRREARSPAQEPPYALPAASAHRAEPYSLDIGPGIPRLPRRDHGRVGRSGGVPDCIDPGTRLPSHRAGGERPRTPVGGSPCAGEGTMGVADMLGSGA
jgi:hypothetical protein